MSDRFPAMARNATVLVIDPSPGDRAQICECLNQLPDLRIIAVGEADASIALQVDAYGQRFVFYGKCQSLAILDAL